MSHQVLGRRHRLSPAVHVRWDLVVPVGPRQPQVQTAKKANEPVARFSAEVEGIWRIEGLKTSSDNGSRKRYNRARPERPVLITRL
jgi:hypothetical protein